MGSEQIESSFDMEFDGQTRTISVDDGVGAFRFAEKEARSQPNKLGYMRRSSSKTMSKHEKKYAMSIVSEDNDATNVGS